MFAPLTLLLSYIGSLPFGMININVMYAEMTKGRSQAIAMAIGAALIEMLQALTAAIVFFRLLHVSQYQPYFKSAATIVFVALAIHHLMKRQKKDDAEIKDTTNSDASPFVKGLLLSSVNFMAFPFWLVILAMLSDWFPGEWEWSHMVIFSICAGLGGFCASMTYALVGRRLIQPDSWIHRNIDTFMAVLFLLLALAIWIF